MEIYLRNQIKDGDRDAVGEITRSTGFFTDLEVDIALEVFDEAQDSDSDYHYIIAEIDGRV